MIYEHQIPLEAITSRAWEASLVPHQESGDGLSGGGRNFVCDALAHRRARIRWTDHARLAAVYRERFGVHQ